MKDVSEKHETHRVAASQALLQMPPEILRERKLEKGGARWRWG